MIVETIFVQSEIFPSGRKSDAKSYLEHDLHVILTY